MLEGSRPVAVLAVPSCIKVLCSHGRVSDAQSPAILADSVMQEANYGGGQPNLYSAHSLVNYACICLSRHVVRHVSGLTTGYMMMSILLSNCTLAAKWRHTALSELRPFCPCGAWGSVHTRVLFSSNKLHACHAGASLLLERFPSLADCAW